MLSPLRKLVAGLPGRALAVVAVLAVGAALGVGVASTPGEGPPRASEPVAESVLHGPRGVPSDASFRRLDLGVDAFAAHEARIAEDRRKRAQELLDRVYPGLAFVTVAVELDPRWERTSETVAPDQPTLVEDERPEGSGSGTRRRVYEPSLGTRESGMLVPDVRSVSVAVVLDESIALDPGRKNSILAAVSNAVGLVPGRDPDVELLVDRFPRNPAPLVARPSSAFDPGLAGWAAILALTALGMAWFGLRRSHRSRPATERATADVPPTAAAAEPEPVDLQKEIEAAIRNDPLVVSRLVEGWLSEGRA